MQMGFVDRIRSLFGRRNLDESLFEDLSDLLVEGDIGAKLAFQICDELKLQCKTRSIKEPPAVRAVLQEILVSYGREISISPESDRLNVFLVLGVNGVGKTTTCAKLGGHFRRTNDAKKIILAAGDTFRAAAIDQLKIHGERLGIRVVAQKHGSDPGAVLWDAIDAANAEGAGLVLADTAGRMHTRQDLLRELAKIDKVVASRAGNANYKRLLVIDSTTGQNGLRQAEAFGSAVNIDGVVLTKLDSSAKGGMAITIAHEFKLPTAFIGTGEGYGDIEPFDLRQFITRFLGAST